MSRPLRMGEMGPGVSSRDLEACQMSNEAPTDEEVTTRVTAAVAGDFQPEHVNGFPMKPDEGSIDLVSPSPCCYSSFDLSDFPWDLILLAQGPIDARSSRPLVEEDDVDCDRRRESTEKQKSVKDIEKKKKRKIISRNVERNRGRRGSPRRTLPTRMTAKRATTTVTILTGWRLVLIESSRVLTVLKY